MNALPDRFNPAQVTTGWRCNGCDRRVDLDLVPDDELKDMLRTGLCERCGELRKKDKE